MITKPDYEDNVDLILHRGFFCLDKPRGPTSHECSAFVKNILKVSKTGHTGTLDADVSGVLPVLLNESVKATHFLSSQPKTYVCYMKTEKPFKQKELEQIFNNFKGRIFQKPPLASAVAKKMRVRTVYSLDLLEVDGKDVLFKARTEGGTYIRNLVRDSGYLLNSENEMTELRRIESLGVLEDSCFTLQDLSDAFWLYEEKKKTSELLKMVKPLEELVKLPRIMIDDDAVKPVSTGSDLFSPGIVEMDDFSENELVSIVDSKGFIRCFGKTLISSKKAHSISKGVVVDIERVLI
ncbi:putative tRNA pseudouridine synthase B [uncultured archaeon]|nr:putative tRNA pseudouridine synthase B [uncultured archaeon]